MRRHLLTLALAGVFGVLAASDASACHLKKCGHKPAPAPCVVVVPCPPPAPVCEPVPVCAPTPKCGLFKHLGGCGHKKFKMPSLCHKKAVCEPAPVVCETYAPAPVVYAAPQASAQATPQAMASGQ